MHEIYTNNYTVICEAADFLTSLTHKVTKLLHIFLLRMLKELFFQVNYKNMFTGVPLWKKVGI